MKKIITSYPQLISIDSLKLDGYQRNIKPSKIKKMTKEFDEELLGAITVSYRDGVYYVVDGQHRVMLCNIMRVKTIYAIIHTGLTKEEEAELFIKLNQNQTKVTKAEVFDAKVVAKDKMALLIKSIVKQNGFKMGKATGTNIIAAYGAIENIIKKFGIEHLDRTLRVSRAAWNGEIQSANNYMLKGLSTFISIYDNDPNYSDERLIKQLSKHMASKLLAEMKADLTTNKLEVKAMNTILKYYNSKLTKTLTNQHFNY